MSLIFFYSLAEGHKKKGNDHFKIGEYYQALEHYTKAIGEKEIIIF